MSDPKLIEYQEVLAERRHQEVLSWTIIGLVYPTAFAAIAFAVKQWGLTSGIVFFVESLGILWLVAGSLVFAQYHFYALVRLRRAWELEEQLGLSNLSHPPFKVPPVPLKQPWHTKKLAILFTNVAPSMAFIGLVAWGVILLTHCYPGFRADQDFWGICAGMGLLIGVPIVYYCVRFFGQLACAPRHQFFINRRTAMFNQDNIRWGWLKFMYLYTIVGAGGFGLGIIFVPDTIRSMFGLPGGDPVTFGITGSVYLSFGLLSILGLFSPLKFVPILLLQLSYKTAWFAGVGLPLLLKGNFPEYGIPIALIFATYIIGDVIAIPFRYVLATKTDSAGPA